MRHDLKYIANWVSTNDRVLDLGCGDGELLAYLSAEKNTSGYGMEINIDEIIACTERGVDVIHQDLNDSLDYLDDASFDTVMMTQSLQQTRHPEILLNEMVRIGKRAIVTFPNFGHWTTRVYLGLKGMMPMSKTFPFRWYNTPNIHNCTFKDFEILCKEQGIRIIQRTVVNTDLEESWAIKLMPNILGQVALYHIEKQER
ncbi:methionine biosynthesis protein MetW [Reinekea thalattae]|uniref:Methionine biosynthesis protein MetW n=1 Tax=Reinekea thalattae TaxID=2593301 RepID=A0A5C8Z2G0_9GAMM|nr:methionine biosynthesis protein MetW [Reinekea thalattae]TXR51438.1 methionine biosynthesis protein MetW [Reinekea thalattae]